MANLTTVKTLLDQMDAVPPFMAYALAYVEKSRQRKAWITLEQFSKISGLPERTVVRIASKISWKGVKMEVASAFLFACGIEADHPLNMRKKHRYLESTLKNLHPFPYLSSQQWQIFEKRCAAWKKARGNG